MNDQQEFSLRMTATGEVDTSYYMEQASIMRAEYIKSIFASIKRAAFEVLSFSFSDRFGKTCSH